MAQFRIDSPQGDSIVIEATRAPTAQEAQEIFTQVQGPSFAKPQQTEFSDPRKMSLQEFNAQAAIDDQKTLTDQAGEFFTGVGQGVLQIGRTALGAVGETLEATNRKEFGKIAKSLPEGIAKSVFDIGEVGEAIAGRIGDIFVSEEEAQERQFNRFIQDFEDADKRKAGFLFKQDETLEQLTETFSIVADPTNFIGIGVAGKVAKAARLGKAAEKAGAILDIPNDIARRGLTSAIRLGARGAAKAATLAEKPLRVVSDLASSFDDALGFPSVSATSLAARALGISARTTAEAAADLAGDSARIMRILGDPSRQAKFLNAVALDPNTPSAVKKSLAIAGTGGQKALDIAYNSIANGVSTGTLQGILAKFATDDPEAIGQAVGAGLALGAAIPTGAPSIFKPDLQIRQQGVPRRRQRPTEPGTELPGPTPRGPQPLLEGRAQPRLEDQPFRLLPDRQRQAEENLLKRRAEQQQNENLKNLSEQDQSLISMLTFAGADMDIRLLDGETFKRHIESETGASGQGRRFFEDANGTIWVNSTEKGITPHLVESFTRRVGTDFINTNPGTVNAVAVDFHDPNGKSFPIDATIPDGPEVKIGGELLRSIELFNKIAPETQQITDLTQGVSRYLDHQVDSLFVNSNVDFLRNLGNRPAAKEAIRATAHGALSRLGLVDIETGSPLTGVDLPPAPKKLARNTTVQRGISNLDNINRNINRTRQREQKETARKQKQVDKAQAKKSKEAQKEQRVLEKQEVKADKLGEKLKADEEARQTRGTKKRKQFLAQKKKVKAMDRRGFRSTDAEPGRDLTGTTLPVELVDIYNDKRVTDTIRDLESGILNNNDLNIVGVTTAAQPRAAGGRLESEIRELASRGILLDFQIPSGAGAKTLSTVRVIDRFEYTQELSRLKDAGADFKIEDAFAELEQIKSSLRQGNRLTNVIQGTILQQVVNAKRGIIKQFDPKNIVSLRALPES